MAVKLSTIQDSELTLTLTNCIWKHAPELAHVVLLKYRHAAHKNNEMHNSYVTQGFLSSCFQAAHFLGGIESESIQNKHIQTYFVEEMQV